MMKLPLSSYFLIVILAIMLTVIGVSLTFPSTQAKLLPIIVCGLIFILGAIELIKELSAGKKTREPAEPEAEQIKVEAGVASRRYISIAAWMLGFLVALYLVGITIGVPLFALSYLKSTGRGWLISFAIAALMVIFTYFTFGVLLGIDLYPGLLLGGTW